MKTFLVILTAISVACSVALVGLLFAGRSTVANRSTAPIIAATPSENKAAPAAGLETWTKLRADDLPGMVEQLRASGFPAHIVRAMMTAQLRDAYMARHKALDPDAESRPFWKAGTIDPRVQAAHSQLYREQQKILRELLGADAEPQDNVNALYQGRRMDSVPSEKVDDVRRLLREADEARSDVFSAAGGSFGPESQRKIAAVDKNFQEALAKLLTPPELEAYNLRNSDTARQVRNNLSAFDPSEEEFRTIYKLQAGFDERFGRQMGPISMEESRRRGEAQRELNEQVKATLGPVRGAEYERATDHSYRQTSQLIARLELPPETTTKVWQVKEEVEKRANELRRDSNLSADDRTKQLAALADEGTKRVTALVGTRGIDTYKQFGGFWLQNLTPRPAQSQTTVSPMIMIRGP